MCEGGKYGESFVVKMSLRQGCVMSPWLFNMFMDGVVREVYSRVNGMGVKMSEDDEREWVLSQLFFVKKKRCLCRTWHSYFK